MTKRSIIVNRTALALFVYLLLVGIYALFGVDLSTASHIAALIGSALGQLYYGVKDWQLLSDE